MQQEAHRHYLGTHLHRENTWGNTSYRPQLYFVLFVFGILYLIFFILYLFTHEDGLQLLQLEGQDGLVLVGDSTVHAHHLHHGLHV